MTNHIVLLSGPLAVGKTAVADALIQLFGFKKISSSSYLRVQAQERGLAETRESLQELGDLLDETTDFAWLVDDVAAALVASEPNQSDWFVDAVRKAEQVGHFQNRFPNVLHVHLTAPDDVLRTRFQNRARDGDNARMARSYDRIVSHPNEVSSRSLGKIADLVIDLHEIGPPQAATAIADRALRQP